MVQVFSNVRPTIPTIPTIPRYFEISIPYHTGSIRYFQMPYLRYQRYPGILRFRYLPYRLNQVFSEVITAIPTIPRYFGTYHTSSIRYFQMRYPRYPRLPRFGIPRFGIPRVFTPGKFPTRRVTRGAAVGPTSTQVFLLLGAALVSLLTSTTIGCGVEVGVGVGSAAEFDGCVPGNGVPDEVDTPVVRFPRLHFHFRYR